MLLTSHTLAGVTIARVIPNPLISWPVALISHFILDLCPHWDFFTNGTKLTPLKKLACYGDFLVGLAFGVYFALVAPSNALNTVGAAFFACLPDGFEVPIIFWNSNFPFGALVLKIQKRLHFKSSLPWGLVVPFLTAGGFLFFLLN